MRARSLLACSAVLLVLAACGDSSTDTTQTAAASVGDRAAHPLVIASVDFENDLVIIRNDGTENYDVSGHFLCNRPTYIAFPSTVLAPAETIEVAASELNATADSGEVGLYTSNDFSSADAIVRYVQWGEPGHGRSSVAVEAGVWADDDFVTNEGRPIFSLGSNPLSAADWESG